MELFVVLVIALLVFGPKKLPEIGRGVGSALREFKRHSRDLMSYLEEEPEPRHVYPETTPSLRPAESFAADSSAKDELSAAALPQEEPSPAPVLSQEEEATAPVLQQEEETPAPVLQPTPTPSNTHPTT
jgi:sec-independent protein translocase protein TatA